MTPQSGLNKTAPAAVLHGSMFSNPCAKAHPRVQSTRTAATAAGLRLLYHLPSLYATRKFPSKTRVFS